MQTDATANHLLQKRFWIFFVVAVAAYLLMRYVSGPLTGKAIIDFEMAKTAGVAKSILEAWGKEGINSFLKSTYVDFIFLIGYSGVLYYGCRFVGRQTGNFILNKAGKVFSYFAFLAAFADAVENSCMLYSVKIGLVDWVVSLSSDMAKIKFSVLFILLIYIIIALLFWLIDALSNSTKYANFK